MGRGLSSARCGSFIASIFLLIASALAANADTAPTEQFSTPDATFQYIATCLSLGKEVVMAPKMDCLAFQTGGKALEDADIPVKGTDVAAICRDMQNPRRLSADVIKRLAAQREHPIAPSGIRILAGVFCDGLDLVGLDIQYSLILDYSVFMPDKSSVSINARNFRTNGDFSFEYAFVLKSLLLTRASVGGSIYASVSYVGRLVATDTKVEGTWRFNNAVVLNDARFSQVSIAGDFVLNGSALSWLWLQSSNVGGALELNNTEARCAFLIKGSTIGYVTADNAGLGGIKSFHQSEPKVDFDYAWWSRAIPGDAANKPQAHALASARKLFGAGIIKQALDEKETVIQKNTADKLRQQKSVSTETNVRVYGCDNDTAANDLEFLVTDTVIQTAFCLTSFAWTAPKGTAPDSSHPDSIIALRKTKIGGVLILRPSPADPEASATTNLKRKLKIVGVSAGAFVFNFAEKPTPYQTFLDALDFSRVIQTTAPICNQKDEALGGASLNFQGQLPYVDDAVRWLESNQVPSSQPFTVFVKAFERAGRDATDLRVKRLSDELYERTTRFLHGKSPPRSPNAARGAVDSPQPGSSANALGESFISVGADAVGIAFQWLMSLVADFGLRPTKAIWWVVSVMVLFWVWIWFRLGIVGFEPKKSEETPASETGAKPEQSTATAKPELWPIGPLFVFDHMIPAYHIREQHYAISRVYRWVQVDRPQTSIDQAIDVTVPAAAAPAAAGGVQADHPIYPLTFFRMNFAVSAGDEEDWRRLENTLVALRLIGIVLSIFLLAAANTLTSK